MLYTYSHLVMFNSLLFVFVLCSLQGSKQLYRLIIHPFLVRHETEIDDWARHLGQKGMSAIRRVSRDGINLAASTVVTSAIKVGVCVCLALVTDIQYPVWNQFSPY